MFDCFARFDLERRPFLEPEVVKEAFQARAAAAHPDGCGTTREIAEFAGVELAFRTLRDPKLRLQHLLDLEFPGARSSAAATVPADVAGMFTPASALAGQVDAFLGRRNAAGSAVARALLAGEQLALRGEVEGWLETLRRREALLLEELRAADKYWTLAGERDAAKVLRLHQSFAFLTRWIDQARERLFALSASA